MNSTEVPAVAADNRIALPPGMEAAEMIERLRAAMLHAIEELEAIDDETAQMQCAALAAALRQ